MCIRDRLDEYGQRDLQCLLGSLARMTNPPRLCATALPDLDYLQRSGRFGRSLYNRLAVLRIEIPALTDRADDLPDLCRLLLSEHAHAHTRDRPPPTLSADALSLLGSYGWPGNVRELSNILLRALLGSEGSTLTAEQFRPLVPTATPLPEVRKEPQVAGHRTQQLRLGLEWEEYRPQPPQLRPLCRKAYGF